MSIAAGGHRDLTQRQDLSSSSFSRDLGVGFLVVYLLHKKLQRHPSKQQESNGQNQIGIRLPETVGGYACLS